MKKDIPEFQRWVASAEEGELRGTLANLNAELTIGEFMRECVNIRLEYLSRFNVRAILEGVSPTRLIKGLIIPPEQNKDFEDESI